MNRHSAGGFAIAVPVALLSGILAATLWPVYENAPSDEFQWCLTCGPNWLDAVLNAVGFIPFGAAVAGFFRHRAPAVLTGGVLSMAIEVLQAAAVPGRYGELIDVVTNTAGTAVGAAMSARLASWLVPPPGKAKMLFGAAALGFVSICSVTAWTLAPDVPAGHVYGHIAPDRWPATRFGGLVRAFRLDGTPQRNDVVADPGAVTGALARRSLEVETTVLTGPTDVGVFRSAPIVVLVAGGADLVRVAQRGPDAVFGVRLRGERYGLSPIRVLVPDALSAAAEQVTLSGRLTPGGLVALADTPHGVIVSKLPVSVDVGWAQLLPSTVPLGSWWPLGSLGWVALLTCPLGFYWSLALRARSGLGLLASGTTAGVAIAAGLQLVPIALGGPPATVWGWLGAGVGAAAGFGFGRIRSRTSSTPPLGSPSTHRRVAAARAMRCADRPAHRTCRFGPCTQWGANQGRWPSTSARRARRRSRPRASGSR